MSELNRIVVAILVVSVMLSAISSVRKRELSLGTGVIWLVGGLFALFPLMYPPALLFITKVIGAKYPASALTLYAFLFFASLLIILTAKLEKVMLELTRVERNLGILERRVRHLETGASDDLHRIGAIEEADS